MLSSLTGTALTDPNPKPKPLPDSTPRGTPTTFSYPNALTGQFVDHPRSEGRLKAALNGGSPESLTTELASAARANRNNWSFARNVLCTVAERRDPCAQACLEAAVATLTAAGHRISGALVDQAIVKRDEALVLTALKINPAWVDAGRFERLSRDMPDVAKRALALHPEFNAFLSEEQFRECFLDVKALFGSPMQRDTELHRRLDLIVRFPSWAVLIVKDSTNEVLMRKALQVAPRPLPVSFVDMVAYRFPQALQDTFRLNPATVDAPVVQALLKHGRTATLAVARSVNPEVVDAVVAAQAALADVGTATDTDTATATDTASAAPELAEANRTFDFESGFKAAPYKKPVIPDPKDPDPARRLLSPAMCDTLSKGSVAEVVQAVRRQANLPRLTLAYRNTALGMISRRQDADADAALLAAYANFNKPTPLPPGDLLSFALQTKSERLATFALYVEPSAVNDRQLDAMCRRMPALGRHVVLSKPWPHSEVSIDAVHSLLKDGQPSSRGSAAHVDDATVRARSASRAIALMKVLPRNIDDIVLAANSEVVMLAALKSAASTAPQRHSLAFWTDAFASHPLDAAQAFRDDPTSINGNLLIALMKAEGDNHALLRETCELNPAAVNEPDEYGMLPVALAGDSDLRALNILVAHGADLNVKLNQRGDTPRTMAIDLARSAGTPLAPAGLSVLDLLPLLTASRRRPLVSNP